MSRNINFIPDSASTEQVKWILARILTSTDKDAARAIGMSPSTVSRWENKAELDAAVIALLADRIEGARAILGDAVLDAAQEKVTGLKHKSVTVRQSSASEILDRVLGKATQRNEYTGADGGPIILRWPEENDA